MLQPTKKIPTPDEILGKNKIPTPQEVLGDVLKKKESTESTSTIPENNSESVETIGSLDGVGSNGFPSIDQNLGVPGLKPDLKTVEQLANPPKSKSTIQAEQNNALKYEKFKQFSTLPDEIKKENAQKVEDEANGVGFLNNVVSLGKNAYNTALEGMSNTPMMAGLKQLKVNTEPLADEKKEAKDLMIRQGVKPKDINSTTVLELAKKIKLQKLNDSDVESRKKEFLSDTDIDFEDLKKGANVELSKISNKDKELLKQKAILEPALKDSDDRLNQLNQQLANFKKNNQQPTPEFVDEYNYAIKYHNDILKDVQKTDNQFADNRDKIGDLKTNLDLFKRQYGKVNNFVSNIGATALDLAAGGFGIVDYGFNAAYGALGIDTGPKENSEIVTGLRGASKNIRDRIAKPINIDNIEDAGDFGDWMANTVIANQVPIYGLIATGPGGILALGGSSLGTKYGDMVQEMNPDNPVEGQILKNYSNAELAWKPVGFGIAETASALVDAHIMKGAARVLASATQPERKLISQTIAKRLLEVGKQTAKGGIMESTDEMATQGVENLIDGKPFTEGMKDAGGAGGAMGLLIPFFAGNIAIATKPFSIDNKIQNSAKKTLALEKELANPNLSDEAKKIIKTNFEESKKTTENLLKKKVKDISKMPNENFQEILRIENEQAKLKEKAVEIKTQDGISDNIKKQLLSDFSNKFNELETDRVDILSGKKTMPKIEETNEKPQEVAVTEQIVETQPQAEVPQQAESEKIDVEKTKYRIAELNNELEQNRIRGEKGEISNRSNKEIKAEIAELESKLPKEEVVPTKESNVVEGSVGVGGDVEAKRKETEAKIKRKDLFIGVGEFSSELGGSDKAAVPVSHKEKNGIEFVEYAHPETGSVDVIVTGKSNNDFVGFYRIYENGKPTNKWSSKFENQSRNKEDFKTMISGVQEMLPQGHEYTEKSSISTDGLRVWEQQLSRGYELQYDKNGKLITNLVAINGDAIVNELGIPVQKGEFENIKVKSQEEFEVVKKALLPYLEKLGLGENDIRWLTGTVKINLPVLKSTKETTKAETPTPTQKSNVPVSETKEAQPIEPTKVEELRDSTEISKNQEVPPVVEQTTPDTKEPASEDSPVPSVSDIKERVVYDREPTADDGVYKIIGDQNNIIYRVNPNTGRIQEFSDGFWSNTASNAIARGTARKEGFQKIKDPSINNESTSPTNTSTNGNVQLGTSNVGESGTTEQQITAKESVQSSVERGKSEGIDTKLKHAREQIEKGVLQWSGDMGSPRIDLGLSWADIRKGESDIKNGKENSVPAKRLIEALDKAKQEGGYHYKYGTGGESQRGREFVSLEDVQRATNEIPLTDSELEQINREQEQLAKEHENYFNSLTEKEQIEILENYENRIDNQGKVSENTEIGKSKNDVSNEKTPSRKEKRIKAVEASIDDLANALKDLLPSVDTNGLKKQGLSQDDIIDFIAKSAKELAKTGIEIDEAIRQVISKLNERFEDLNVDEKLVKEKIRVEKSIAKDELSDFRDLIRDIPQKDEVKNYLSGETIERIHGETRNDQSYNAVSLADLALHGKLVMDKAKELFGDQYVEKTLDFLESANLEADEKAIQYVALENEMDARISENPNDLGERKLQDLVRKKSQAHLRKSAIAINAGRLRAIMKYGIDVDKYPYEILTKKQKEARNKIEKLVQHTSEDINKEAEIQEEEGGVIISQTEKEIKSNSKKAKEVANKIRQYKIHKPSVFSSASPGSLAWDGAIEIIAKTVEAGGTLADAIQKGIEHIKATDWYKNLKDDKKKEAEDALSDYVEKALKPKDKKIQDIVKQALIDAGFSRKVKIKGEEKTLLDWKKLAGEESSIPKLKENVEKSLKAQGYTDSQIKEIGKSLEDEYIRLGADIVEKGLRELENRNKLKPSPTRKTDAKRLSELYNYGLFNGEKATEYDNLLNKTLGLSEFDVETYQKIKSLAKALASVYNQENNGRKISEIAVQTLNSTINHQIKSLLATNALKNGTKAFNVASAFDDYVGLSMRALLGSVSTLTENKISGEFQVQLQKAFSSGKITPELKKQIEADKKAVFRDITRNAGLFYGDTNTSLTHSSRFEEWLNGKADKAMAHTVVSSFLLRAFLDGVDSSVKVRLTQKAFVKNVIKLLTSETNPNGKMSAEEAIKYVSEQLTGENFKKALETAKSIIEDVNKEQGKKVIKDTDEAIHRFAMDLVKENLLSSDMLTMDNIESAYKSAYKSAGRSIGHEANNIISAGVNLLSSTLNKRLEKAIQEKNYALATSLTLLSTIQKSIINPFVGGGTNWVILGLEKSGNPLGYISVIHNATERRKLDLSENKTDITQSLYRESIYQDSAMRLLVGTGMAMAMFAALTAGDDDEELLGKLNQWLKDNPWAKKHFNKLAPEAVTFLIDMKNGELSKHWQKILGMKNDYFDNTKTLIKTFSDENSSMSGAFGAFLGQNLSSPGPWKTIKDVVDILRGIKGVPPVKTDYKTNGFWNGYFRAGLIDFMKLRPGVNYDLNSKIDKVKDDEKKLNSEIDSFVKYIYDEKLSDAEINKKIDEKFSAQPLKKERIKESIKNRAEEEKLKRSGVDPFYIRLKRASNDEIKAILFQDRFKDLNKTTPAEQKEIEKGMNAIKFGEGSKEFWDTYWRLAHPENYKKKPIN